MSKATESRIPVSLETRKKLRVLKAQADEPSYDSLLSKIVENDAVEASLTE
ncbi:hypothetical protein [Haladaptatus salinisoli]|uniref:hypothetical protein n=1 Tax=Haladaptatus salinisoli TaxID=2884876 RepID=UPI001D0B6743|nr:hypothetical protein [Haladaptatus salinisoli]